MKRALKLVTVFLAVMAGLAACGLLFIVWVFPRVGPAPEIEIEADAAVIERGRYLTENVTACLHCHSSRDWSRFAGPVVPGTRGMGGMRWDRSHGGVPGELYAGNITPAGVGDWTDGELYRAIAVGVGRDDQPLHPVMPYPHYQALCNDDRVAIVAYLRTLAPVENEVPTGRLRFPMSVIVRMIPHAASPPPCPDPEAGPATRGEYLVNVAACGACHTPRRGGAPDFERFMAGGEAFPLPHGIARAANLTREPETGIGRWSEDDFVARFASFRAQGDGRDQGDGAAAPALEPGAPNTVMPWHAYAGLHDDDLRAIFAFLDTLETRHNPVKPWTPTAGSAPE